ncbi:Gfo/Idh/MocA family protein [Saliterribacillus persicus]|uniref:Putative dehydrogenase n=1 Tax=Saliterribacillus persicus TaxID=930114 RepID=A0A368YAQ2_9BACI|nr:Gfo/Idh/MocA family oxidoreductase [Saliterribacillus persicus]RCW77341.1 putative dehydrogenase [Saliterribacillus persicus]
MIQVAIIGTGSISQSHLEGYLTFPDECKIVALCDLYLEKAEALKEKYSLEANLYANYENLFKSEKIDLVSVCTPPYTHAEISINAMRAKAHVLVEKPMASSLEECDQMLVAANKYNRKLSVIAQNRFTTTMMKLKAMLDSGLAGPIVHTQVDSFWWRGYSYYDLWWRGTWEKEGGGCTLNHAVHHIDIFQWMKGIPSSIQAVTSNTSHDNAEVEDISIAIAKYDDGSLAQITSSVVHHGEEQQLIFQGKAARISAPFKVRSSSVMPNGFPERNAALESEIEAMYESLTPLEYEGHKGQIEHVLQSLTNDNIALLSDGIEGRSALEIITAIYQSAHDERAIDLPLEKSSKFYTREGLLKNINHFHEKKNSIENFIENKS